MLVSDNSTKSIRNIATYNHILLLYFAAFNSQLTLSKITLKEKKDIHRKQSQQNFKERVKYVIYAFKVF
jgi:pentatricopeptide repeat protein